MSEDKEEKLAAEVIQGAKGKEIDRFLRNMEQAHFTGAVLVEQNGQILLCKGYGEANHSVPNTSETIFCVASITKQFTAAAIMLLVEEGKIHLNTSINEYLPSRFCTDEWEDVTVEHLLTHTSGIPNYAEWDDYWEVCKNLTVDKVIRDVQEQGLQFPPGSNFSYSNTGYTLLGKIIEKQGDMPYRDFIKNRLLIPAGMTSSGIHDKSHNPPTAHSAMGFWIEHQVLEIDKRDESAVLYSDGGLYSTVRDMAKWSGVLDGKTTVLSRSSIKKMIDGQYGLFVDRAFGYRRIHHNGSMAGFRGDFCKFPDEGILIVILGNNADFVVEYLTGNLSQFLLNSRFSLPEIIPFPPNFNYAPFLNTFDSHESEEEETYTFKLHHQQLSLKGESNDQCFLLSNQRLYIPTQGQEFELQKNGKITVYGEEGEKVDVLSPPSFFGAVMKFIKKWI
jgi:CubicO group peptidase (beta-lactamase class C family)